MPVNFSHFGPEKFSGSRDCSPASHTMLISVPEYFLAASTARSAAVWALAGPAIAVHTSTTPASIVTMLFNVIAPSHRDDDGCPVLLDDDTEMDGITAVKHDGMIGVQKLSD